MPRKARGTSPSGALQQAHTAVAHDDAAGGHVLDTARQQTMLLDLDPPLQAVFVVVGVDRHGGEQRNNEAVT